MRLKFSSNHGSTTRCSLRWPTGSVGSDAGGCSIETSALKEEYPEEIVVYLIEAESLEFGQPLPPRVEAAMDRLVDRLVRKVDLEPAR